MRGPTRSRTPSAPASGSRRWRSRQRAAVRQGAVSGSYIPGPLGARRYYALGMTMGDLCAQILAWQERYPDPAATAGRNAESRVAEDRWLARFHGADALDRDQVQEMIDWKFSTMPHRRAQAMKGIAPDRWQGRDGALGAADLIRQALATPDDYEALALTAVSGGGIHRFGPAMGSVLLAACRPGRFTVADSRALAALRHLGLMSPGGPEFQLRDWL